MSTVNFLCGYCNQMISASRDHLGQHVECPHCQQVVQAPADAPPADATEFEAPAPPEADDATELAYSPKAAAEQESIFSSPDEDLSDDVFGSPSKATVEMPADPVPNLQLEPSAPRASAPDQTVAFLETRPEPQHPDPVDTADKAPTSHFTDAAPAEAATLSDSGLPTPTVRQPRPQKGGSLGTLLLIFLIPYALVTTACIAYLLYLLNVERTKPPPFDPLERLPDSNPEKGGPKRVGRVRHDEPLPDKLKTVLGRPVTVGDVEVTPVLIENKGGRLALRLKLHNTSTDTAFDPLPKEFVKFNPKSRTENKPYTFLQVGDPDDRAYGAILSIETPPPQRVGLFDGILQPGETSVISLETTKEYDKVVLKAGSFPDKMLWRVQVRRGFVDVKGHDVSATTLLGVEFHKEDITNAQEVQRVPPPPDAIVANAIGSDGLGSGRE